jgi:hypothetical protein
VIHQARTQEDNTFFFSFQQLKIYNNSDYFHAAHIISYFKEGATSVRNATPRMQGL